jgi:hypothetical protein
MTFPEVSTVVRLAQDPTGRGESDAILRDSWASAQPDRPRPLREAADHTDSVLARLVRAIPHHQTAAPLVTAH